MTAAKLRLFISILLSSAIFTLAALDSTAYEKDTKAPITSPIRISYSATSAPFSLRLPDGKPSGLYIEFWELWSKYSGTPVVFIESPLASLEDDIQNDRIDFRTGLFKSKERSQWSIASDPFHQVETRMYYRANDIDKASLSILDQRKNDKIAVQNASYQLDYIKEFFPDIPIVTYTQVSDVINGLLSGQIKAIVGEVPHMETKIAGLGLQGLISKSTSVMLVNKVYALVAPYKQPLIDRINQGIKAIPQNELVALEKKWLPYAPTFFQPSSTESLLSASELEWLAGLGNLTIGVDQTWPPYDFVDDKGIHTGIISDYLKIVSKNIPNKLIPQVQNNWLTNLELVKQGKVDLLSSIVKTKLRQKYLSFSDPFITFPAVIAIAKNTLVVQDMDDLNGKKVGIEGGYVFEEILREKHPEYILIPFGSTKEALENLKDGNVDAFIESLSTIQNEIKLHKINNIEIAAYTPYELEISVGVRKGLEPIIPILNKIFSSISTKQKTKIRNEWLSDNHENNTRINQIIYWLLPILAFLILVIVYIVRSNRLLQFEIEERQKIEIRLEEQKYRAEAANKSKNEFLANMSHEIRTPMNAVLGMSDLLSESNLTQVQSQYNQIVKNSAASLLVIINDILDLSKIEAGKLALENKVFSLQKAINEVHDRVQFDLEKSGNQLQVKLDPQLPNELIGDPTRLNQIILNLVNNAMKFTEKGKITVSAFLKKSEGKRCMIEFCIADTGKGIAEKQLSKIFEAFEQEDKSTTRKYGGTGLGLSICKQLCHLMQGDIWVESREDNGSQFYFTVYLEKISEEKLQKSTQENKKNSVCDLNNCRILVVDDNQVNLLIASKMLTKVGAKVKTVTSGRAAIESLETKEFDAILMDIQMPDMDGYETTRYIRDELNLKNIPIIAISANVMAQDIEQGKQAGMNAHAGKPLEKNKLIELICFHTQ